MTPINKKHLLTDAQMLDFIARGYHLIEPEPGDYPEGVHERVLASIARLKQNPGNHIYEAAPDLKDIYSSPRIVGALMSVLGDDMVMDPHRHLHTVRPGHSKSQTWHQDGTNVRHHQTWCCLAMYYPQGVTAEMGPTAILPGTHFRNAPTDSMVNYTNIKGAMFLTVKAGTVAITHFDLWHAGTLNRSKTPRHMLKFLFNRVTPPVAGQPSWNHDPATAADVVRAKIPSWVGPIQHYGSDYYKEWELRKEMWDWYLGRPNRVPAGAFRTLLS